MKNVALLAEEKPVEQRLKASTEVPLVVDLDGTLVHADTLHESLLLLAGRQPWALASLFPLALRNRAAFKRRLAQRVRPDPSLLPYNDELLRLLKREASAGRSLILATGADQAVADDVAKHLGIFAKVHGSNGVINLTGRRKAELLSASYGRARWLYAGNSTTDLAVWAESGGALVVNGAAGLAAGVTAQSIALLGELPATGKSLKVWLRMLRLHQWSKNLLIFAPLLLAHQVTDVGLWGLAISSYVIFGCGASATYLLNDLLDLEADRRNSEKRHRPLAAGRLSVPAVTAMLAALAGVVLLSLPLLPVAARWMLLVYLAVSTGYSFKLKTILSLDVVTLSLCYVLRLVFGSKVTNVPLSIWTMASAGFFFTALAFAKRLIELRALPADAAAGGKRRAYLPEDIPLVGAQAAASGFLAVLVVALYINSPEVRLLYSRPSVLWLQCPVLIWWLSRILILAGRGAIAHDPVSFAIKDRVSWGALGLLLAILVGAK